MKWILRTPPDAAQAQELADALSVRSAFPLALARVLVQRGIQNRNEAERYFRPDRDELHDPRLMADLDRARARLLRARTNKEKILVFADYDVDGSTALVLMVRFLRDWGFWCEYYQPDRYTEGYGLSTAGVDWGKRQGCSLMISLDCGIKGYEPIAHARDQGIDVIVCDHHTPGPELPPAYAVLDPKRADCKYPFKELTGCGVGYKLCCAVQDALLAADEKPPRPGYHPLEEFADLVALSIACDIVPLTGENRVLAHFGLQKIRENPSAGLRALMQLSDRERDWNISDLVFFIGPHINSAGRLHHANDAVQVLLGESERLPELAKALHQANNDRKQLDRETTQQALAYIHQDHEHSRRSTTVLYDPGWSKGVVGIVASRLIERHYRPTVLLTRSPETDTWVGSARSVANFDLYRALEACDGHMLRWGGHKYAAGLSVANTQLLDFCQAFETAVAETILPEQKEAVQFIDAELPLDQVDYRLVRILGRMEPFGPQNRKPVFLAPNTEVIDQRILKQDHLRLTVRQHGRVFSAIGFGLAHRWEEIEPTLGSEPMVDLAYQPVFNTWQEKTRIDLHLKDLRAAESA